MAFRKTILATSETYHIFNRSVAGIPIFRGKREYEIFLEAMEFYLHAQPPTKFSLYRASRDRFEINSDENLVTILCFCLMPNHFHFMLKQEKEAGIKQFIQRLSNSFAHYFSVKYKQRGHVFEGNFKAVRIETDEHFIHLSRYIHLNPVTAYIVEDPKDYPYSSYNTYLGNRGFLFVDPKLILTHFPSAKKYEEFVLNQKDYQRTLQDIKHLALE